MVEKEQWPLVWRIQLRRAPGMSTRPEPYYASSEAERDWYLTKLLHRPADEYVVDQVPDPLSAEDRADIEARKKTAADTPPS